MAKQSGLHQIRGKVGEHSYYRQTGVTNGLIRGINQGLSSRVKTSDEYANTRLNNAEFGQAGRIAKALGRLVTPKYRAMILPFSQSIMAKYLLSAIKTDPAPWGQRNISDTATERVQALVTALNAVSKGDFDSFGVSIRPHELNTFKIIADDPSFDNKLAAIGADGVIFNLVFANAAIGVYSATNNGYIDSYSRFNVDQGELTDSGDEPTVTPNFPPSPGEYTPWMSSNFFVMVLMPYRTIGEEQYILQEHCTFRAMEIPS